MPRIIHPHPAAGRQRFLGVEFRDGVATVDELHPIRAQALEQHGFTIEDEPAAISLDTLKARDLRDIAAVEGIDVPPRASKAELIEIITAAQHTPEA